MLISDFKKWAEQADNIVTRDINSVRATMKRHRGRIWDWRKKRIFNNLYEESLLKLMQTDDISLNKSKREVKNVIQEFLIGVSSKVDE